MGEPSSPATSIIGFDSAWTDSPKAPGAICTIRIDESARKTLVPPVLVSFDQSLAVIEAEKVVSALRIVALDQPTIVPNLTSLRPVDRVAASLIAWLGGGMQPANRSKIGSSTTQLRSGASRSAWAPRKTPKRHGAPRRGCS